jgi:hypothetical protein
MGWVVNATPQPLNPPKRPGIHCIGGCGWAPRLVWTIAENLTTPFHPEFDARTVQHPSESLYRQLNGHNKVELCHKEHKFQVHNKISIYALQIASKFFSSFSFKSINQNIKKYSFVCVCECICVCVRVSVCFTKQRTFSVTLYVFTALFLKLSLTVCHAVYASKYIPLVHRILMSLP